LDISGSRDVIGRVITLFRILVVCIFVFEILGSKCRPIL